MTTESLQDMTDEELEKTFALATAASLSDNLGVVRVFGFFNAITEACLEERRRRERLERLENPPAVLPL